MLNFDELIIKIKNLAYERFGDSREKNIYVGEAYKKVAGYFLDKICDFKIRTAKAHDIDLLGHRDNQWYAIQVTEHTESDEVFPERDLGDFVNATRALAKEAKSEINMILVLFDCLPTPEEMKLYIHPYGIKIVTESKIRAGSRELDWSECLEEIEPIFES